MQSAEISEVEKFQDAAKTRKGAVFFSGFVCYNQYRTTPFSDKEEGGLIMELQDCVRNRRSIRRFTGQTVPQQVLEELVETAGWAPSWKNTQISRYIAVRNPAMRREIARRFAQFNAPIIESCDVLIAQTFVKARCGYERDGTFSTDREEGWQYYDCGIAAQTFCLAAHDRGLGTVILGIFDRPGLEEYLQVPPEQELMALIALGYPDQQPEPPRRKDVSVLLKTID